MPAAELDAKQDAPEHSGQIGTSVVLASSAFDAA
jgi:hypothetical protein